MTIVHLVRHGDVETDPLPKWLVYGRLPGYGLSEMGKVQADWVSFILLTRHLQSPVTVVCSSPLQRAVETAKPLADTLNLPIAILPEAIEWTNQFAPHPFGPREGFKARSWLTPKTWRLLANPFRPSWAEPYEQVYARMNLAVAKARRMAEQTDGEAVIFTHELPLAIYRRGLEGRPLWHPPASRRVGKGSILTVSFRGGKPQSMEYREAPTFKLDEKKEVASA